MPFLKRYQLAKTGIIHGFSGSYQQAKGYIDLGFKLGVGSTITYSRAKKNDKHPQTPAFRKFGVRN